MERRWGMRKTIGVDVVIDNQPVCLLRGHIGNVSVGGLFVQTEPTNLRKNSRVELVLLFQQDGPTRVYRMPALVVRTTADGVGLMFDQYDVDAFRALVVLLLAQRKATSTASADAGNLSLSIARGASAAWVSEGATGEPLERQARSGLR